MMGGREDALDIALETMREGGADAAQAGCQEREATEFNVENGRMSLLRTTLNVGISTTAFVGGRRGTAATNSVDTEAVRRTAASAATFARSSEPDPANAISPYAPPAAFAYGPEFPDRDAMYDALAAFAARSREAFPKTGLDRCTLVFTRGKHSFANSNGVRLESATGIYDFSVEFTTKEGGRTTSMNYSGAARRGLDRDLHRWGSVDDLMRQQTEQLDPKALGGAFVGEVILAPDCLHHFVTFLDAIALNDNANIKGSSPYAESLGKVVASPLFTLRSCPASGLIERGYFLTPDGFMATDALHIESGVLRCLDLSLYASNRTGLPKSPSAGGCWVVDPGESSLEKMLAGVERGLLVCRYSGDWPSPNGDFSGVAKNSFAIENGRIIEPVTETMISGNVCSLFSAISAVSRERIDFGVAILPWVLAGGATISGK